MPQSKARKERRKLPFLKAFKRVGSIIGAAKACRISRDAVHDWLRNDPSFAREFAHAKRHRQNDAFASLESATAFFVDVIRPVIPAALWPKVSSEIALAAANMKRDLKVGSRQYAVPPSDELAEVSLAPMRFQGVAIRNRAKDTSAQDFSL